MKLTSNQFAPIFSTADVYGNQIDLKKLKGQKIYLAFERNAGCPVCNLRTHELLKHADFFIENNVRVVLIYESPVQIMKSHLGDNNYPFHFVSDPGNTLYNLYRVERSMLKVMRSMVNGIFDKVKQGTRLFKKPMKQDGHLDRIPAEFVIAEDGKLSSVHYGRFVGDHIPLKTLQSYLKSKTAVTT